MILSALVCSHTNCPRSTPLSLCHAKFILAPMLKLFKQTIWSNLEIFDCIARRQNEIKFNTFLYYSNTKQTTLKLTVICARLD